MKLRECIETIEREKGCCREDAIFEFLNEDVCIEIGLYGHSEIYYCLPDEDFDSRYWLKIDGLTKIQALKLKNKFERRLIKLAEGM